jgi:hypothetical protein
MDLTSARAAQVTQPRTPETRQPNGAPPRRGRKLTTRPRLVKGWRFESVRFSGARPPPGSPPASPRTFSFVPTRPWRYCAQSAQKGAFGTGIRVARLASLPSGRPGRGTRLETTPVGFPRRVPRRFSRASGFDPPGHPPLEVPERVLAPGKPPRFGAPRPREAGPPLRTSPRRPSEAGTPTFRTQDQGLTRRVPPPHPVPGVRSRRVTRLGSLPGD